MISSPDLLAFAKETVFSETNHNLLPLPKELSLPKCSYAEDANPWAKKSGAKFNKDFILLSEFSEQVGPQPLFTLPPETKACGTFDLNHFSLRIMSVDYQTTLARSPGYSSMKLNFVEDSNVVFADSSEGVFAYVHHLTLYDLNARGFVRPFCLAYVSSDENKITQQLLLLSAEFSKASECLKTGNRKNFANDLEKKLIDLKHMRILLLKELENTLNRPVELERRLNGIPTFQGNGEVKPNELETMSIKHQEWGCSRMGEVEYVCDNGKKCKYKSSLITQSKKHEELASVEKSIKDYESILKQVTLFPTRKLRNSEFSPYEPDDLPNSIELNLDHQVAQAVQESSVFIYTNTPLQVTDSTSSSRFDKHLKTLEELCDDFFHHLALQQLHSIERSFRGDACHLYTQQLCRNLLSNLKSTNFLFEDPCDLYNEVELKITQPSVCQPQLSIPSEPVSLDSYTSCEPISLDSYTSCVEMVPIKLEFAGPKKPSDMTSSRNAVIKTSPEQTEADDVLAATVQENMEYISTLMKTSISSGESIEVLGTEKSFKSQRSIPSLDSVLQRPPSLPTFTALEGQKQGRVPTRRTCSEDSIEVLSITESIHPEDLRASYPYAINEESIEQETDALDFAPNQVGKIVEDVYSSEPQSIHPTLTMTPPDWPMTLKPNGHGSQDPSTVDSAPQMLLDETGLTVPDGLSDCVSHHSISVSTSSECTFSTCPRGDKLESGTRRRRGRVGRAALKFLRQFPFAIHAIYSLLSGRTLVVLGSEEAAVRQLVTALSMYMPNLLGSREGIQAWTSTSLQLPDLLNWKLIGFNRTGCKTRLPHCLSRYSRYLSILDVDLKTLCSPPYTGVLLNLLVEPRSHFKRGNTYFMFAQSVQCKLVTKAFLLTFSQSDYTPKSPQETLRKECFLSDIHSDDKKILNYLSELLKLHFLEVPPNVLTFNYTTTSIFKL